MLCSRRNKFEHSPDYERKAFERNQKSIGKPDPMAISLGLFSAASPLYLHNSIEL
jgi:hypothetical protein